MKGKKYHLVRPHHFASESQKDKHKHYIEKMGYINNYLKEKEININVYKSKEISKTNFSLTIKNILGLLKGKITVEDKKILNFSLPQLTTVSNINDLNVILTYIDYKYHNEFHDLFGKALHNLILDRNKNNQINQKSASSPYLQSHQNENTQPDQNDDDNNELSLMDNSFDFESHSDDSLIYYFDENEQRSYFQAIDNDFP